MRVQVLDASTRQPEWTGDLDDLLQTNDHLSEIERMWLSRLEVGSEFRCGGPNGPFVVRRIA